MWDEVSMSVRSALHVLAYVLAGVSLVIVAVFGAIVVLAYRDRRPDSATSPAG
jgi:hypothetical protein